LFVVFFVYCMCIVRIATSASLAELRSGPCSGGRARSSEREVDSHEYTLITASRTDRRGLRSSLFVKCYLRVSHKWSRFKLFGLRWAMLKNKFCNKCTRISEKALGGRKRSNVNIFNPSKPNSCLDRTDGLAASCRGKDVRCALTLYR